MAHRLNELRQAATEAEAAEKALLSQRDETRTVRGALLAKRASGVDVTDDELKASADGLAKLDRQIEAARERTVLAMKQRDDALAADEAEKKEIAAGRTSGRVEVKEDQAEKWAADPKRGFKDHRDFLVSVQEAGRGRKFDPRLKPLATIGSDEQGVYSDPAGGFLVPHGVAPGILSVMPEDDPLVGLVTPVTMTAPTVSFNARADKNHSTSVSGGLVWTRRPETVDGTASRMLFEQVTLTANESFGLAYASEKILTDSPQSFVDILAAGFADERVAFVMNERINGSGVGERQGLLNAGCKIEVSKETGQKAATIVKENIDKMAARCWRYSRAVWLANHNTRPQLKSIVQVVGTGGAPVPYFTRENGAEVLDGRPIFFTEYAKTLGTAGDLALIVPSEYLEGTYQSQQYAESIHVRFAAAERAFRFYTREDAQWWWRSALTPLNGDTLSPVVTLATRA